MTDQSTGEVFFLVENGHKVFPKPVVVGLNLRDVEYQLWCNWCFSSPGFESWTYG